MQRIIELGSDAKINVIIILSRVNNTLSHDFS